MTANISAIIKMAIYRHGITNWRRLASETRFQLIADEFKVLRQEINAKYGSGANYLRHWIKNKGIRKIDYENFLARQRGFPNMGKYQDYLYQQKGFDGKADYARFRRLRRKHHKSISDFDVREIQLKREGVADWKKELERFILIRKGMRTKKMEKQNEIGNAYALPEAYGEHNPKGMMKEVDYPSKGKDSGMPNNWAWVEQLRGETPIPPSTKAEGILEAAM